MKRTAVLGLTLAGVLGFAAFGVEDWSFARLGEVIGEALPGEPSYDRPVVGERYPDLCLLDPDGNEVRLSDFEGKLILIEPIGMT